MNYTVNLRISDKSYAYIIAHAKKKGITVEELVAQVLEAAVMGASDDDETEPIEFVKKARKKQ